MPTRRPISRAARMAARSPSAVRLPPRTLRQVLLASKKHWKRFCKELKRCQKNFSENAVHDSRIAARRLLSLAELLRGFNDAAQIEKICQLLKRHLDQFDDLRDTHVQLLLVKPYGKTFPAAAAFRKQLRKQEKQLIRRTRRKVKAARVRKLRRLVRNARKRAEGWLAQRPEANGNEVILKTIGAAFAAAVRYRQRIDPARSETIHRTRVAFKRFRYMMEALADFGSGNKAFVRKLQHYQTLMGEVQDLEILLQGFEKFARKLKSGEPAARAFRQELLDRKKKTIARYLAKADQLQTFWTQPTPAGARFAENGAKNDGRVARKALTPKASPRRTEAK